MLAAQNEHRSYEEAMRQLETTTRNLRSTIDDGRTEVGRLARELAAAQARMTELTGQLAAQQSTMDGLVKQNAAIGKQLDGQRDRNIQLADQLRRSQDQIKEYIISLENAQKQARFLKEQLDAKQAEINEYLGKIKQLEDELAAAKQRAGEGVVPAAAAAPAGEKIQGEVLAVKADLASLNVGSASGVKKGMLFIIYRQQDFIAHFRVADVGASTCAGVILNRVGEVRQGDKATTRLD
jgi:chromosome segregation ATPase